MKAETAMEPVQIILETDQERSMNTKRICGKIYISSTTSKKFTKHDIFITLSVVGKCSSFKRVKKSQNFSIIFLTLSKIKS